jgi:transposase
MRRVPLKGSNNILKRLLVHAGGFNLALIMRKLVGVGKPRRLQGACACIFACFGLLFLYGWSVFRKGFRFNIAKQETAVTF